MSLITTILFIKKVKWKENDEHQNIKMYLFRRYLRIKYKARIRVRRMVVINHRDTSTPLSATPKSSMV